MSSSAPGPPISRRFSIRRVIVLAVGLIAAFSIVMFIRFATQVHALRERRASTPGWSFPSRVYSDGLAFTTDRPMSVDYLRAHLAVRGYRRAPGPARTPGTYAELRDGFEIHLRGFAGRSDPASPGGPERVRLTLRNGRITRAERLGGAPDAPPPDLTSPPRLEPVPIALLMDEGRMRRAWVPLARIPQAVQDAVIASEDRRFYRHFGFDVRANIRALVTDVRSRGIREGASTITQQLARGLFLGRERAWKRKIAELFIASGLELLLTKEQILEMYLNSVYFGQGDGDAIGGVAEAARHYFDAPVESLGVEEAALLVGLIPAPNAYTPFRNPRLARNRRDGVLRDLVATGRLSAEQAAVLTTRPLRVRRGPPPRDDYPSFTGYVLDYLQHRLPREAATRWGLSIFTTLDLVWQPEAEAGLAEGVETLERWLGREKAPLEGAFVAIEPSTGFARAVVGGRAPRPGDFNRAFQARRQPGSAIKPVVYAAALDAGRGGRRFTPASVVPDLRREFQTPEGPWSPRNDEGDYHAEVTLAKALVKSLNVATANLVEAIGADEVTRYAERFGLGRMKPVASVGLGSNEVTLLALTGAYAIFPNLGVRREVVPVRAVTDAHGRVVLAPPTQATRILPEQSAALMTGLLEDVVIFGVSYPLRKHHGFTRPVAGKTGTTNDYNDAWFVGFTPDVVAGVWIGFDAPRSLRRPAAESALPVWASIMKRLLAGFPPTPFPARDDLELVWIDPWTGGRGGPGCPSTMRVPFVRGTAPTAGCRRDHVADWAALAASRAADSLDQVAADSTAVTPVDTLESQ